MNGAGMPVMHGRDQVHDRLPVVDDLAEVDLCVTDRPDGLGKPRAARDEQVPILERLQTWAQIEPQQASECHCDVGIAVRVDGQLGGLEPFILDNAELDPLRGTELRLVRERLMPFGHFDEIKDDLWRRFAATYKRKTGYFFLPRPSNSLRSA